MACNYNAFIYSEESNSSASMRKVCLIHYFFNIFLLFLIFFVLVILVVINRSSCNFRFCKRFSKRNVAESVDYMLSDFSLFYVPGTPKSSEILDAEKHCFSVPLRL